MAQNPVTCIELKGQNLGLTRHFNSLSLSKGSGKSFHVVYTDVCNVLIFLSELLLDGESSVSVIMKLRTSILGIIRIA